MYPAKPQNCKQRDHKKRSSPTTKVGLDPRKIKRRYRTSFPKFCTVFLIKSSILLFCINYNSITGISISLVIEANKPPIGDSSDFMQYSLRLLKNLAFQEFQIQNHLFFLECSKIEIIICSGGSYKKCLISVKHC